jgi:hypothetical protein
MTVTRSELSSSAKTDDPVAVEGKAYPNVSDYWVPRLRGA